MASRTLAISMLLGLSGAALLSACDTPPVVMTDAGTDAYVEPDAPPPVPYTCETDPTVIDGVLNTTESVTFDTTMTAERPRDLGLACGNPAGEGVRWARQEVVEYHVPGTGPVSVEFSAVNAVTPADFNTVIQVRTACDVVPTQAFPPTCIDDATMTDPRSRGAFQASGGDTLYFIVTGYSDPEPVEMQVDEGVIQVDFTPRVNTPPTVTSAYAIVNGVAMVLGAEATDAEGPIFGFALKLYTAAGQIDFDGDGDADDDDILPFGWESVTGTNPYTATSTITPTEDGYRLAEFCTQVGCTDAAIAVFDQQYAASEFLRFAIMPATAVGLGDACNGLTEVCTPGLNCTGGTCTISTAVNNACTGAAVLTLAAPIDATPTTTTVMSSLGRGAGTFNGPCGGTDAVMATSGHETVYSLTIDTPGTYRLDLTTTGPGTGARDTVLYVRGEDCWDSRATNSLGCNDDTSMTVLSSTLDVEVTEGTYFIYVEFFGGVMTPSASFEMTATLTLIP